MERRSLVPLMVVLVAAVGCTSTRTSRLETGMFDDKPERMVGAYEALAVRSGVELLSKKDLEMMGFNLKAPNVENLPGPIALRRIFGDKVLQSSDKGHHIEESLEQLSEFRGFVIPYRHIRTVSDRIYFSEQEVFRQGKNLRILVLFRGDELCYHQLEYVEIDTYSSRYAFAQAVLFAIKGPGKAALSLLEVIKEYENPGIELIAPIPIVP